MSDIEQRLRGQEPLHLGDRSAAADVIERLRAELAEAKKFKDGMLDVLGGACPNDHRSTPFEEFKGCTPCLRAELAECKQDAERYRWRPIETAPKDGSSVLLLVEDSDYPLEDERATATIGAYGTDGGTEFDQTWNFAGWDWCQDRYVRGNGTPTHWMPLPPVEANAARKGEEE